MNYCNGVEATCICRVGDLIGLRDASFNYIRWIITFFGINIDGEQIIVIAWSSNDESWNGE